jgi:hypothetical protein
MRKTIIGFGAMLLFLGCSSQEAQRSKGPEPKSKAAPQAKATVAPQDQADAEPVARRFLMAMFENDAEEVKRLSLPHPDQAVLWQGAPLKPAERDLLRKQVEGMTAREANAGEVLRLPDGRVQTAASPLTGPDRTVLVLEDGRSSLVFLLVQAEGQWRVDAGSFIAARKVVKAAPDKSPKP